MVNVHKVDIRKLETLPTWKSVGLYLKVYTAIFVMCFLESLLPNSIFTVLTIIFVGGRQHSLYILNHDASHGSLFKTKATNKVVATVFSNLVKFHHPEAWSYVQWRRVHMRHHGHLFTKDDPNYVGRQKKGDTERTYNLPQLVKACLLSVPQTINFLFMGRQDYVEANSTKINYAKLNHLAALFFPFRNDREMENERRIKLLFFLLSFSGITYFGLWRPFLLLWILPMYLIYPMILRFHDLTEHRWERKSNELVANTRSVQLGVIAKLLLSHLPRGLHKEHHMYPRVPVVNLPKLSKLLQTTDASLPPMKGFNKLCNELVKNHKQYIKNFSGSADLGI